MTSFEEVTGRREFKGESRTRQIAGPVHFGVVKKLHFLLPAFAALVSCDKNSSAGAPKAAEATGKFLKRVGEEIEEQAEKPVPPLEEP